MKAKEVIKKLETVKRKFVREDYWCLSFHLGNVFHSGWNAVELGDWFAEMDEKSPQEQFELKRICIENSIAHYKSLDPEAEV